MRGVCTLLLGALYGGSFLGLTSMSWSEPLVANAGFEKKAYGKYPGYAGENGGIPNWSFRGGVGVNPWWDDPQGLRI